VVYRYFDFTVFLGPIKCRLINNPISILLGAMLRAAREAAKRLGKRDKSVESRHASLLRIEGIISFRLQFISANPIQLGMPHAAVVPQRSSQLVQKPVVYKSTDCNFFEVHFTMDKR
jgi:hypothetical protein